MTYLISDHEGFFVRWSDSAEHAENEFAQRVCDACVDHGVDATDIGPAETTVDHPEYPAHAGYRVCYACRAELQMDAAAKARRA